MLWWLFQNVVITAALALVVWAIARAGRIGPVARHALWVIVLVKFVTPPIIAWPWGAPDPFGLSASSTTSTKSTRSTGSSESSESSKSTKSSALRMFEGAPSIRVGDITTDVNVAPAAGVVNPVSWLGGLWIAGSGAMLLVEVLRMLALARRVRRAAPAGLALAARVETLALRLGIRAPRVVVLADQASPAIWCVRRPMLLWPAELPVDVTDACVDGLIVHELAHIKRRDHVVGWIELAAGVAWWWNPLFWYVRGAVREQAELACDAWVISALPDGRRAYAESLLAVSGASLRPASSMAVIGMRATSRRVLERRLVMIMKGRAPLHLPSAGVLSLVLIAGATLPAFATSPQTPQTPPPPPAPAARPLVPAPIATPTPPAAPPSMPLPASIELPLIPEVVPMTAPAPPAPARPGPGMSEVTPIFEAVIAAPQTPPAPPPARRSVPVARTPGQKFDYMISLVNTADLPADGQQLAKNFETERDAIQKDADQKIAARQEALVKSLQDLQDKYTKAGKLDEAVAIRDYLRSLTGSGKGWVIR